MRDAGDDPLTILNQWVICYLFFVLLRLAHGVRQWLALRRPDHGADTQRLRLRVHIGHIELRLERSHLAAEVFAGEEPQCVVARPEREPGVVLKTAAPELAQ